MHVTRRGLLVGAAVGGGLVVAWALRSPRFAVPLTPGEGEAAFGAWLKIGRDGVVTVAVPQLEMGQGVSTVLPQVVAMELGADWRQVAVEPAPVSGAYANIPLAARWAPLWEPLLPFMADDEGDLMVRRFAQSSTFTATADGTSLAAYEMPCREAAASARAMLAMAAAERFGVSWEECHAQDGFIMHGESLISFGELAIAAAQYSPPDPPPLLPTPPEEVPSELGAESPIFYPRLDLPAKIDGTYQFAGDVRLPGMVYAAIRHGPLDRAELVEFDAAGAESVREIVSVVQGKRWLAAVATNWWAAERALDRMGAIFRLDNPVDSNTIAQALDLALAEGEAQRIVTRGEGNSGLVEPSLISRYDIAPAQHATLETASATARLEDGKLELWLASQAPELAREAVASALGMADRDVVLYPMPAGGSFDRRLEHDHAIEVALIAREIGRPVQLVWSRWQEFLAGRPRAPVAAELVAVTGEGGYLGTLSARIAVPATAREFGHRLFGNKTSWAAIEESAGEGDALAVEGADPPYSIPNVAVDHVPARLGLPTGRMRGNAHGYTAFFTESFIDEVALANGREPLSYRMEMLGDDLRLAECLQRVARLANWDGGLDQSGQGVACHRIGDAETGGRIAAIATARPGEGGVTVERIVAVADIGRIVNLDIARQQIEGGLVFGIGLALGSSVEFASGLPTIDRLAALNLPALKTCPAIEVEFIASDAAPFDPGELGAAVAAPAIANALHSATGLRLRSLPLLSDGL
ncbi:MAG TPA: molybdopterin cofactor-binding domain-containing protein [Sphingomonadaceae bacterium]|nr:molybdopterin cofactor-binding domain-containing protein [Sphingomonadaceae bacterium]